ncbi:ATP-binding protein [Psychrobium sp. MM17-31]|nr:ATP-binding protein [Psychrobium sp. MM17-31]
MNLFLNASYACEENGVLDIRTYQTNSHDRDWVIIKVQDNGKGMSPQVLKKIFDPFYTTKPVGVGTGLGLSVSFGIIDKHGGKISAHSEEGQGTTFTIVLPIDDVE